MLGIYKSLPGVFLLTQVCALLSCPDSSAGRAVRGRPWTVFLLVSGQLNIEGVPTGGRVVPVLLFRTTQSFADYVCVTCMAGCVAFSKPGSGVDGGPKGGSLCSDFGHCGGPASGTPTAACVSACRHASEQFGVCELPHPRPRRRLALAAGVPLGGCGLLRGPEE